MRVNLVQRLILPVGLALSFALSQPTSAATIYYDVFDHPSGGVADPTYMLRLNDFDTFSANRDRTGVQFYFDPMTNDGVAYMSGVVQHFENNRTGTASDGGWGDLYGISATFRAVSFTDGAGGSGNPWWGTGGTPSGLYDDALADLLANSDEIADNDPNFVSDLDRIYFALFDFALTPLYGAESYLGDLSWDEYPGSDTSPSNNKRFLIQKNHRTNLNVLAAAGWAQPFENGSRVDTPSDFLFIMQRAQIPEPGTLLLMGLGLAGVSVAGRRKARSSPAAAMP